MACNAANEAWQRCDKVILKKERIRQRMVDSTDRLAVPTLPVLEREIVRIILLV